LKLARKRNRTRRRCRTQPGSTARQFPASCRSSVSRCDWAPGEVWSAGAAGPAWRARLVAANLRLSSVSSLNTPLSDVRGSVGVGFQSRDVRDRERIQLRSGTLPTQQVLHFTVGRGFRLPRPLGASFHARPAGAWLLRDGLLSGCFNVTSATRAIGLAWDSPRRRLLPFCLPASIVQLSQTPGRRVYLVARRPTSASSTGPKARIADA